MQSVSGTVALTQLGLHASALADFRERPVKHILPITFYCPLKKQTKHSLTAAVLHVVWSPSGLPILTSQSQRTFIKNTLARRIMAECTKESKTYLLNTEL